MRAHINVYNNIGTRAVLHQRQVLFLRLSTTSGSAAVCVHYGKRWCPASLRLPGTHYFHPRKSFRCFYFLFFIIIIHSRLYCPLPAAASTTTAAAYRSSFSNDSSRPSRPVNLPPPPFLPLNTWNSSQHDPFSSRRRQHWIPAGPYRFQWIRLTPRVYTRHKTPIIDRRTPKNDF